MSVSSQYDVVIIGAGIAGTALAAALAGSGLSLALVEAQPLQRKPLPDARDVHSYDARVSALTPISIAFLDRLGAWAGVAGYRHCAYSHMTVWDADGTGRIEFDRAELDVPALGHIVENRAIVDGLLAALEGATDIAVHSPDSLQSCQRDDDGTLVLALESGECLRARLVVGADGALSRVRQMLEFRTREWDYGHRALVCTVQTAREHQHTAWQRFLPTGPLAFLPLPGKPGESFSSIVWSLQDEVAEEVLALADADFCLRLGVAFEETLGPVLATSPRFAFPLRQRHAVDYIQPGVALVADAAHTIHPLAGQGINLGLLDVAVLAEELLRAHERGLQPGRMDVLSRYQRRRKGDNLLMMGAMDGFKRLFEQQALPVRWLRNAGMRGVGRIAPLKQRLMRQALGIS
ncbi:FAD-binding protein [Seongchinamella sediminis]|uniref:FAD-binding protein n=1 Tax=Seongchinamella sediminis TaxID=2283635 RepID=A0A3L7E2Y1_9GAMM|nr:UbiH/UbiF/VisC/COQ6 family ubiquinone biosynthesis hydroxylase [Seongchinamella sediminis]RLQ23469.1 FAD-binding protein [Seongchinamella sediminis]